MDRETALHNDKMRGAAWAYKPSPVTIQVMLPPEVYAFIDQCAKIDGISIDQEITEICSRIAERHRKGEK